MTTGLRHILDAAQFTSDEGKAQLERIFAEADRLQAMEQARTLDAPLRGRLLATLFYEPSTRTRLSFEAAMLKLGGTVLGAENARDSSSAVKGETIADTVRVVGAYADAIVLRHFEQGTAEEAAEASPVPILNAGDGAGEHPTQALADIYTMRRELGREEAGVFHTPKGLRVVLLGDLLYGRTVHSLLPLLALDETVSIDLVSPESLRLPPRYRQLLKSKAIRYAEHESLDTVALEFADVLYVTRVQKERFPSTDDYARVAGAYTVDTALMERLKDAAILLHALPRLGEIAAEVDADPRAAYFRQARNAMYVRMALLNLLLG